MENIRTKLNSEKMRGTMDWLVLGTGILSLGIAVIATSLSSGEDRQTAVIHHAPPQIEES